MSVAPTRATGTSNTPSIQRIIGAELEVEKGGLQYDTSQFILTQGEVIGRIDHETSGYTTEIHAEQPNNDAAPGSVTLEFATGKYRNRAAESASAMATDAEELAKISTRIAAGDTRWLRPGFTPAMAPAEANIQINVSPVGGTSTQLGGFVAAGATLGGGRRGAGANMVPDAEGYGEISQGLTSAFPSIVGQHEADQDRARRFYAAMLTPLAMHISGLMSFYFRTLTGTLESTPKNAFQAMPRYDLTKLIDNELKILYGDSFAHKVKAYSEGLAAWVEAAREPIRSAFQGTMTRDPDQEIEMLVSSVDVEALNGIPDQVAASVTALIWGGKILVGSRPEAGREPEVEPLPILETTSSKIPISAEESPEGAYEIRKPFERNVPIASWGAALNAYELELYKAGVRYLDDH